MVQVARHPIGVESDDLHKPVLKAINSQHREVCSTGVPLHGHGLHACRQQSRLAFTYTKSGAREA